MVFYNVFVAFVGLNNNTIVYAQYWIWIGLIWPIPRSGRKCQYRSDTDTEYRIGAPLLNTQTLRSLYQWSCLLWRKGWRLRARSSQLGMWQHVALETSHLCHCLHSSLQLWSSTHLYCCSPATTLHHKQRRQNDRKHLTVGDI